MKHENHEMMIQETIISNLMICFWFPNQKLAALRAKKQRASFSPTPRSLIFQIGGFTFHISTVTTYGNFGWSVTMTCPTVTESAGWLSLLPSVSTPACWEEREEEEPWLTWATWQRRSRGWSWRCWRGTRSWRRPRRRESGKKGVSGPRTRGELKKKKVHADI